MNLVIIMGRITRDLEMRYSQGAEPMAILKFSVAVNRRKKDESDFINCIAFGKTAENIEKYFGKGSLIAITGHIQTGSYEKDGHKVYTTDIVVDGFDFTGEKKDDSVKNVPKKEEFTSLGDDFDESELPF